MRSTPAGSWPSPPAKQSNKSIVDAPVPEAATPQESRNTKVEFISNDWQHPRPRKHTGNKDQEIHIAVLPIQMGQQTVFFESETGRIYALVGQIPAAKLGKESGVVPFAWRSNKAREIS
jgi:hypothetical protein